ncbi:MAG: hypothetical protein JO167_07870, partial [Alphaproteobacteria bacterium]|nr:hypothetical protein [Alphaproteobacteria bacterium]
PLGAMLCVAFGGLWLALWQKTWRWLGVAPIAVGLWLAYTATPPDILVDRDGQAVAIRTPAGDLRLFRKSKDEFAASEWLKRDGETLKPDDAIATPQEGIRCDAYACRAQTAGGQIVSNVLRIEAFGEECATAAVVVSAIPVRKYCKGPQLVIDNRDAVRANGYAVWLTPLRTVTVQDSRGVRPWSASPPPKRQYRRIKPTSLP